ncbi:hypothetical protein CEXT_375831, partial [Caerostris extrusa]
MFYNWKVWFDVFFHGYLPAEFRTVPYTCEIRWDGNNRCRWMRCDCYCTLYSLSYYTPALSPTENTGYYIITTENDGTAISNAIFSLPCYSKPAIGEHVK